MIAACGTLLWRSRRSFRPRDRGQGADATPPTWRDAARWVALAAVPSGLLIAVTAHISTDVAAVPLLWVLPLTLYLLTFVIVFARRPIIPHWLAVAVQPLFVLTGIATLTFVEIDRLGVCRAPRGLLRLRADVPRRAGATRPAPKYLTAFYLWMSAGGMIGGIAAGLIAPHAFNWVAEYPILLALAALCRGAAAIAPSCGHHAARLRRGRRMLAAAASPAGSSTRSRPHPSSTRHLQMDPRRARGRQRLALARTGSLAVVAFAVLLNVIVVEQASAPPGAQLLRRVQDRGSPTANRAGADAWHHDARRPAHPRRRWPARHRQAGELVLLLPDRLRHC